uniref:Pyrimidine 5'-nucleotidase n=1 Tax=Araucaria cunninghamii TaxID=56994 RepID=A0A0D6QVJ1_ARACU
MEREERVVADRRPRYDCLLFDLDDTLYPFSSGLTAAGIKIILDYVVERLGVDRNKVTDFCTELYKTYGTVLEGLRAVGYEIDIDDYHSFDHERLPYENLEPDPVLKNLLLSMPQRKIIFTNGYKVHAAKVLSRLGLEDCFEGVICFETLNSQLKTFKNTNGSDTSIDVIPKTPIICKPSKEAIEQALRLANADPERTIFFDDSPRNIAAGKRAGLHTVLVGTPVRTEGADFALESIHNIKEALPEIW